MTKTQLHASCVEFEHRALLIIGNSGDGKSTLALELMAFGATLVADDRVDLLRIKDTIFASAPSAIAGKIEARGLGVLSTQYTERAILSAVINMSQIEEKRLPLKLTTTLLSRDLPLIYRPKGTAIAAKIFHYMRMIGKFSKDV